MDRRDRSSRDHDDSPRRGRDEERSNYDRDDSRESRRGRDSGNDGGSRRRSSGSGFEYRRRDVDSAIRRSETGGNTFDSFLTKDVRMYKVQNDNELRILPPTWDGAEHWGLDIYVHYQVGPDEDAFLCLNKMKGEACPICEERRRADKAGDEEYAKSLEPTHRALMYVVDRNNEREGALAWPAPMTVDRDILKVSIDKKSRELLPIDSPEDGYDVTFERTGKARNTKYVGTAVARRSTPLDNDEALQFAVDHPLPSILQFYSYDHIAKVFGGGTASGGNRDADRGNERGGDSRNADRDSDRGHAGRDSDTRSDRGRDRGSRSRGGSDDPTWASIHEMTYDELCALVDEHKLDIDPDKSKDDNDLADWVCQEMHIEEEKQERSRSRDSDDGSDRLSRMRRGRE